MFDCKLVEGQNLKKCVNALKELIEQAAWDISEDGIQLQSMDSSHVALVQMNIGSDSFETFRCDQAMQIGLNMTNLHKIFGAFSNGSVSINAEGEDADTVRLEIKRLRDFFRDGFLLIIGLFCDSSHFQLFPNKLSRSNSSSNPPKNPPPPDQPEQKKSKKKPLTLNPKPPKPLTTRKSTKNQKATKTTPTTTRTWPMKTPRKNPRKSQRRSPLEDHCPKNRLINSG